MYAQGLKHYYVNELSQTSTGRYIIPVRWIMRDGELTADAYDVHVSEVSSFSLKFFSKHTDILPLDRIRLESFVLMIHESFELWPRVWSETSLTFNIQHRTLKARFTPIQESFFSSHTISYICDIL